MVKSHELFTTENNSVISKCFLTLNEKHIRRNILHKEFFPIGGQGFVLVQALQNHPQQTRNQICPQTYHRSAQYTCRRIQSGCQLNK